MIPQRITSRGCCPRSRGRTPAMRSDAVLQRRPRCRPSSKRQPAQHNPQRARHAAPARRGVQCAAILQRPLRRKPPSPYNKVTLRSQKQRTRQQQCNRQAGKGAAQRSPCVGTGHGRGADEGGTGSAHNVRAAGTPGMAPNWHLCSRKLAAHSGTCAAEGWTTHNQILFNP